MVEHVLRQIQRIIADPGEQGWAGRPLPTSSKHIQVCHRGDAAPVQQVSLGNLPPGRSVPDDHHRARWNLGGRGVVLWRQLQDIC